jgi:phosphoserine phosphatase
MFGLETSTQSGADTYNIYNPVKLYVKELSDRGWKVDNITSGGKHLTVTLKRRSSVKQFQSALLLTSTSGALVDVIVYN